MIGDIVIEVKINPDKAIAALDRLSKEAQSALKITEHHADLAVEKSLMRTKASTAEHTVALKILEDTRPFVPAKTGAFDASSYVERNRVVYSAPYARFLYYGKLMVDPETESPFAPAGSTKVLTDTELVFNTTVHGDAQAFWYRASKAMNKDEWLKTARRSIAHGGWQKNVKG